MRVAGKGPPIGSRGGDARGPSAWASWERWGAWASSRLGAPLSLPRPHPTPLIGARAITLADFKTPGAELQGIYTLRNAHDADQLVSKPIRSPLPSWQALPAVVFALG